MRLAVVAVLVLVVIIAITIMMMGGGGGAPESREEEVKEVKKEVKEEMMQVGYMVGQFAPSFMVTTISGETVSLSDFRGKYVAVWFMVPQGCPICASQARELKKLQMDLGDDLVVIAITLLDYEGVEEDLKSFMASNGLPQWLYAVDRMGLGVKYNIIEMGVVLLDPRGRIIYRGIPSASYEDMSSAIRSA